MDAPWTLVFVRSSGGASRIGEHEEDSEDVIMIGVREWGRTDTAATLVDDEEVEAKFKGDRTVIQKTGQSAFIGEDNRILGANV